MKLIALENLQVYDEEIKTYILQKIQESTDEEVIQEDTYLKFPTIGNEKTLYIDTSVNLAYRWSDSELKYYALGSDYNEIRVINGNL